MSDFVFVLIATFLTAMISYVIFALIVRQVPAPANFGLQQSFDEVSCVMRQLRLLWRENRHWAMLTAVCTFFHFYMRMKCRNPIGTLDATLVGLFIGVLIVMATIGPIDVIHEIILWLKASTLGKNIDAGVTK